MPVGKCAQKYTKNLLIIHGSQISDTKVSETQSPASNQSTEPT